MPIQKYEVSLSAEERKQLTKIVKSGNMPARTILRANILLAVDRNGKQPMTVQEAAIAFNTSATTVQNVRTRMGRRDSTQPFSERNGRRRQWRPRLPETSRLIS